MNLRRRKRRKRRSKTTLVRVIHLLPYIKVCMCMGVLRGCVQVFTGVFSCTTVVRVVPFKRGSFNTE
jgi:hypothetical protein